MALAQGPGPNCPIRYTVDASREARDNCVFALRKLRNSPVAVLQQSAIRAAERWLHQWNNEHDRLLNYSTLAKGLKNPQYAPKFQAFHADISKLKFVRGPNQFGKTFLCAAEIWFYFQAKHPWIELPAFWADRYSSLRFQRVEGQHLLNGRIDRVFYGFVKIQGQILLPTGSYLRAGIWSSMLCVPRNYQHPPAIASYGVGMVLPGDMPSP